MEAPFRRLKGYEHSYTGLEIGAGASIEQARDAFYQVLDDAGWKVTKIGIDQLRIEGQAKAILGWLECKSPQWTPRVHPDRVKK